MVDIRRLLPVQDGPIIATMKGRGSSLQGGMGVYHGWIWEW